MLLDELQRKCSQPIRWDSIFATIVVTNSISTDPEEIRGLVTMCIGNDELRSTYFADICQSVKEYENLPDFKINTQLSPAAGLRQFVDKMPDHVVLLGTNVDGWMKPLLKGADELYHLFDGRTVDYLDLGQVASIVRAPDVAQGDTFVSLFPQNKYRGRAGSLARLASMVELPVLRESIGAEKRAHMISEILRKNLERELEL